MKIIGFPKEDRRFERESLENHWFSKENWHRGGTEKIEKSAGAAASAIGVLWIFKSSVFAWRFFDFFRTATNETPTFESENDGGEEAGGSLHFWPGGGGVY